MHARAFALRLAPRLVALASFCFAACSSVDTQPPIEGADMAGGGDTPDGAEPGPDLSVTGCQKDADCAAGQACCGAICIDVQGDAKNCGGCGRACGAASQCCGGECTDTATDVANCGGCAKPCSFANASASCAAGVCAQGACHTGWGDCNASSADGCEVSLHTDVNNCAACGTACAIPNGIAGCADACYLRACMFGWDDCDMDAGDPNSNGCETSVLSDNRNCGGCGKSCLGKPNAQVACVNSACLLTSCNQGWLDCNNDSSDGCEINGATDASNCGGCGTVCAQGLVCKGSQCTCPNCNIPNASSKCVNNMCVFDKCNPGFVDCNNNPQDGCEADIANDAKNCGACGNVCPQNMNACVNSQCTMSPCIGNQQWQRVTCTTPDWVWSRDRTKAMTVQAAAGARVLATGCMHGQPQPALGQGVCSLDGKGWVSTKTFVMQGCDASWYHLGGRFSGNCGGHDGDTWRHLVLTDNDCFSY